MKAAEHLVILGASARAAAFSALRAGLRPWCADLFADQDLQQRCGVTRLGGRYPDGFLELIEGAPPGPWMYTGGLENRPRLVRRLAQRRPLWGNDEAVLSRVRDPEQVGCLLHAARLPVPALAPSTDHDDPDTRWLLKPRNGAGGAGVRFWNTTEDTGKAGMYRQEYIDGLSCSLLYVGAGREARLLGMTRQLVGVPWLHAEPFHYCGSIGLFDLAEMRHPQPEELGRVLTAGFGLSGLFGVDGVLREGVFWPVEINPRYTASVEVVEYATGAALLACQAEIFQRGTLLGIARAPADRCVGKAILFARAALDFPADGPWLRELRQPTPVHELPLYADIPTAGQRIERGRPILTFFAGAGSPSACEDALRQMAADLDRWLFSK
jgi:predicted ATP-grasp superfamily ATP-dependent carboligase